MGRVGVQVRVRNQIWVRAGDRIRVEYFFLINVEFFQKVLDHEGVVRLWSDQEEKCSPLIV